MKTNSRCNVRIEAFVAQSLGRHADYEHDAPTVINAGRPLLAVQSMTSWVGTPQYPNRCLRTKVDFPWQGATAVWLERMPAGRMLRAIQFCRIYVVRSPYSVGDLFLVESKN